MRERIERIPTLNKYLAKDLSIYTWDQKTYNYGEECQPNLWGVLVVGTHRTCT